MEFMVSRTSMWSDEKPCINAYRKTIPIIDVRSVTCPSKIPLYGGETDWWYSSGKNHKVNDMGCIERELECEDKWFIELNSLEDLLEFKSQHGNLVIESSLYNYHYDNIEIYDGYRE